jgi:hypothetical protein
MQRTDARARDPTSRRAAPPWFRGAIRVAASIFPYMTAAVAGLASLEAQCARGEQHRARPRPGRRSRRRPADDDLGLAIISELYILMYVLGCDVIGEGISQEEDRSCAQEVGVAGDRGAEPAVGRRCGSGRNGFEMKKGD